MDPRPAFLQAASTLVLGFMQLAHFRIVGNISKICILNVHVTNRDAYESCTLPVVKDLKTISPQDFQFFDITFQESSMVLAYAWLESFLDDVEEALYLMDPSNLGEQLQVKLGKILEADSVEELLHDVIRRRVRDRSQWSLINRLTDLNGKNGISFTADRKDIEWITRKRNEVIHDRRIGKFKIAKKRVTYESVYKNRISSGDPERFLMISASLVVDLYLSTCRALKISQRFKLHRQNLKMIESWKCMWSSSAATSSNSLQPTI